MINSVIPLRIWQDPLPSSEPGQTQTSSPQEGWKRIDSPRTNMEKITPTEFCIQKAYIVDRKIIAECTLSENGSTSTIQAIWDTTFSVLYLTGGQPLMLGPDPCVARNQRLYITLPEHLQEYVQLHGLIIRKLNSSYDNSALNPLDPHGERICYIPANANISDVVRTTARDIVSKLYNCWQVAAQSIAGQLAPYMPGGPHNNS